MRANPDFILWLEISQKVEKTGSRSGPRVRLSVYGGGTIKSFEDFPTFTTTHDQRPTTNTR